MSHRKSKLLPQYFAGCSAALGAFALGSSFGWSSTSQLPIKSGELGFTVTNNQYAWISSLCTLGAFCVCIPIGNVIDVLGRKRTMLALMPPYVFGWLLIIFAQNITMLYVARFLLGMCGGSFCILTPIYTTEIAETHIRGILGCLFQLNIAMGVEYSYIVGSIFNVQMASVFCGIVPIIMAGLFIIIPETPTYFLLKGENEKAADSLRWLRGSNYDISQEMFDLMESNKHALESKVPLREVFLQKTNSKALFFSLSLMVFQQLSGINAIIFYATAMFKLANPHFSENMSTILMGLMMVLAVFISLFFIDRFGRRPILITSALFMCLSNLGTGLYFIFKDNNMIDKGFAMLPVFFCCIYVMMFSFGFGGIPWLFMAEIFSDEVKCLFSSLAATTCMGLAFLVSNLYPPFAQNIGTGPAFCIFGISSGIAVPYILFYIPETKNKTFLEIQQMLEEW